jgi:hypothetical protein
VKSLQNQYDYAKAQWDKVYVDNADKPAQRTIDYDPALSAEALAKLKPEGTPPSSAMATVSPGVLGGEGSSQNGSALDNSSVKIASAAGTGPGLTPQRGGAKQTALAAAKKKAESRRAPIRPSKEKTEAGPGPPQFSYWEKYLEVGTQCELFTD